MTIQYIVRTCLPNGQAFTSANLDVSWFDLVRLDASLPRPTGRTNQLRVRITRPDGTVTETLARLSGMSLATEGEPPGRLVFDDLLPEAAPVGSELSLVGYETSNA